MKRFILTPVSPPLILHFPLLDNYFSVAFFFFNVSLWVFKNANKTCMDIVLFSLFIRKTADYSAPFPPHPQLAAYLFF